MLKKSRFAVAVVLVIAGQVTWLSSLRADAPAGRYSFPTTTTVLDTKTGLVWQRKTAMAPSSQASAVSACFNNPMGLAGTGWRLPTVKELMTLVDFTRSNGLDSVAFPSEPAGAYWSSTTMSGGFGGSSAWIVNFPPSNTTNETAPVSYTYLVRCVR